MASVNTAAISGSIAPPIQKEIQNITMAISFEINRLDNNLATLYARLGPMLGEPSIQAETSKNPSASTEYGNTLNNMHSRLHELTETIQQVLDRLEF